ncbi:MAG: hypothetical protein JWM88_2192 [Verrucomicrobia bacterium]|nr:hypothetical protein [Verrucomicrobiota bacterium]
MKRGPLARIDSRRGAAIATAVFAALAALPASATEPAGIGAGWKALTLLNADGALRAFSTAGAAANLPEGREARFGRALALLAKQPITPAQVDEARSICAELAAGGIDDAAQGAGYFLGRIAQHHQETPDLAEAARQYRRLIEAHPSSIWADTARTRLAVLELYAPAPEPAPARLAHVAGILATARTPAARSELHLLMADAIFYFGLPVADSLPHLSAAEKLGLLDGPARADVLVQIAEISAMTGDIAQARKFYQAYLAEFPLDQRQFMVREKLRALEG